MQFHLEKLVYGTKLMYLDKLMSEWDGDVAINCEWAVDQIREALYGQKFDTESGHQSGGKYDIAQDAEDREGNVNYSHV